MTQDAGDNLTNTAGAITSADQPTDQAKALAGDQQGTTPDPLVCMACGVVNKPADLFCTGCGSRRERIAPDFPARSQLSGAVSPNHAPRPQETWRSIDGPASRVIVALVVGSALALSAFLPWATLYDGAQSFSGFPGSYLLLAMGAVVAGEALLALHQQRAVRMPFPAAAILVSTVATIWVGNDVASTAGGVDSDVSRASGFVVALIACIVGCIWCASVVAVFATSPDKSSVQTPTP
jgi:hypothetical protein